MLFTYCLDIPSLFWLLWSDRFCDAKHSLLSKCCQRQKLIWFLESYLVYLMHEFSQISTVIGGHAFDINSVSARTLNWIKSQYQVIEWKLLCWKSTNLQKQNVLRLWKKQVIYLNLKNVFVFTFCGAVSQCKYSDRWDSIKAWFHSFK